MPNPIYPEPERLYPVEPIAYSPLSDLFSAEEHRILYERESRRLREEIWAGQPSPQTEAEVPRPQVPITFETMYASAVDPRVYAAEIEAAFTTVQRQRMSFEQRITERDRAVAQWFSDQARALNAQRNDVVEENSRIDHFSTREEANAAYLAGCEQVCVKPRYYYSSGANKVRLNSTNRHAQWVRKAVDVGLCDAGKEPPIGDGEFLEPQSPSPPVTNIEA